MRRICPLASVQSCSAMTRLNAAKSAGSARVPMRLRLSRPIIERIGDRKSAVSGKSVSVRVDLGGRRIIKKQKMKHMTVQQGVVYNDTPQQLSRKRTIRLNRK